MPHPSFADKPFLTRAMLVLIVWVTLFMVGCNQTTNPQDSLNSKGTILMVLTAADAITLKHGEHAQTGAWAEEIVIPAKLFFAAQYNIVAATPNANPVPIDPRSLIDNDYQRQLEELDFLKSPIALESITDQQLEQYQAIFIPGGHGPLVDLAKNQALSHILTLWHSQKKPIAALCHGPAALLSATDSQGVSPFSGFALTAFSAEEEYQTPFAGKLQEELQDALSREGMLYMKNHKTFESFVVEDRNLFTGQNPASSQELSEKFLSYLHSIKE